MVSILTEVGVSRVMLRSDKAKMVQLKKTKTINIETIRNKPKAVTGAPAMHDYTKTRHNWHVQITFYSQYK